MRLAAALSAVGTTAATIVLAVPARADVDTDFANQLHTSASTGSATTTRGWPRSPVNSSMTGWNPAASYSPGADPNNAAGAGSF
jgi:hypothetical protein